MVSDGKRRAPGVLLYRFRLSPKNGPRKAVKQSMVWLLAISFREHFKGNASLMA